MLITVEDGYNRLWCWSRRVCSEMLSPALMAGARPRDIITGIRPARGGTGASGAARLEAVHQSVMERVHPLGTRLFSDDLLCRHGRSCRSVSGGGGVSEAGVQVSLTPVSITHPTRPSSSSHYAPSQAGGITGKGAP